MQNPHKYIEIQKDHCNQTLGS